MERATGEPPEIPEASLPFAVNFLGAMTGWGDHSVFARHEAILRGGYPKVGSGSPGWGACLAFGLIEPAPRRPGQPQAHRITEDGLTLVAYGPRGGARPATEEEAAAMLRAWDRVPEFADIVCRTGSGPPPPTGEIRAALRSLYPGIRHHTAYRVSVACHDSLNYLLGKPNTYKIVPAPLAGLPQYGERPSRAPRELRTVGPTRADRAAAEWRGQFPAIDLPAALALARKVHGAFGRREFRLANALGGPWAGAADAGHFYACCEYGLLEMRAGSTSEMAVHMRLSPGPGVMFCEGRRGREDLNYGLALSATRPGIFKVLLAHIPEPPYSAAEVEAVLARFLTVDAERRAGLTAAAFWSTMQHVVKATGMSWEGLAELSATSQSSGGGLAAKNPDPEPEVGEPWKNLGFVITVDEGTPAVELRAPGSKAPPIRLTMRHQVEAMIRELQASLGRVGYHEGARPRVSAEQPRRIGGHPRALGMPTRRMGLANGGAKR